MEVNAELTVESAVRAFVDPRAYADPERWHRATALLRREAPIMPVTEPGYPSFTAVTRHADVWDIATRNDIWTNSPMPILGPSGAGEGAPEILTLVHLDDPRHKELRGVTVDWFKPRGLRRLEEPVAALARAAVDRMADMEGACDFATDVAMPFPLQVILSLLGFPEQDYPMMLRLTQEIFGPEDPEMMHDGDPVEVVTEIFGYFTEVIADRRANPQDDLATVIALASPPGEPINIVEQLSYLGIIATAGHDTTSAAIAGGVQALVEHPGQLDRLRRDMSLVPLATEEIIRWVTPVKHFLRTAAEPTEVNGYHFEAGEHALLSYWSANRDEAVFDEPFAFDVGRDPNRHLAFGFGAHYCLGAALARMEIRAFLNELIPRLESIELAGEAQLVEAIFVSGLKHLPVRYSLT